MGVVYRAHDPVIDRDVAVKVMRTETIDPEQRPAFLQRFLQEVRATARCAHPAIVTVYDFGGALEDDAEDSPPFIVMEMVEGGSLAALLRVPAARNRLSPLAVLLPVLEALGSVHALGVVHRDLKPANILLTSAGYPKITDFGIARLRAGALDMALTQTGALVGTPSYMAPEQARGEAIDHRADVFSAGCILYEILAGQTPFGGANVTETILRLGGPDPVSLAPIAAAAPHYVTLLERALAKPVAERFESAGAFAAALRGVSEASGTMDETMLYPAISPGPGNMRHSQAGTQRTDSQLLATFGHELAKYLGPIASTLVQRATAGGEDPESVCQTLAAHLKRPEERAAFLRKCGRAEQTFGTTTGAGKAATQSAYQAGLPAEALAAAQSVLARQVGPIAAVMVRRAAAAAAGQQEFLDALAAQMPVTEQMLTDLHAAMEASRRR
jgi:serine/threonine-protein kinase